MYKQNNKIAGAAFILIALGFGAEQVTAELYVSPVVRGTVQYNEDASSSQEERSSKQSLTGSSTVHGEFLMKEKTENLNTVMRFGQNVPLFVAIERVVPESSDWHINLDDGLDNSVVNWEGGNSWEDVLGVIADQNDLTIKLNHKDRAIGVSKDAVLANHLANKIPEIWRLSVKMSLRENLSVWSKKAGWRLEWDPKLDIDYPISHGAVLTGSFTGSGGVIAQVLDSLKGAEKPLRADFHTKNNVLFITEAGYKQEVMY